MRKVKLLLAGGLLLLGGSMASAQNWTSTQLSEGKYYLQNVGSGLFWGAANDWGTRASLLKHPEYVTLHSGYKLESQVSNGGTNYYFNGDYMDNGSPVTLTIEQSGDVFSIANGSTYYGYDGQSSVLGKEADRNTQNGQWRIFSEQQMLATLDQASPDYPVDATFLILDPNFGRNNRNQGAWSIQASNKNLSGGNNVNNCAESYHATFTLAQTITNVPNGIYELTAQGFYRQDGSDNNNLPYFYMNSGKQTFPLKTGTENSMSDASVSFTNGEYTIQPIRLNVTDGTITLGAKLESNTGLWCIWDNFVLTYYGVDLSAYEATIDELKAQLGALLYGGTAEENILVNSTVQTDAESVLSETDSHENTQEALEALITKLNNAISAVTASKTAYKELNSYLDLAENFDADGQYDFTNNEAVSALLIVRANQTFEALTDNDKAALEAALAHAALVQTTEGANMTLAIANPSFETGNFTGWTNSGMALQTNTAFQKDGTYYAEAWQPNGTMSVKQTITLLKDGVYRLEANTKARGVTSASLFAAGISAAITVADQVNNTSVEFAAGSGSQVEFGFEGTGTGAGSSWLCVDNFRLTYVGQLPDLQAVDGGMNADVATAMNNALDAYRQNKNIDNYNAAQATLKAAEASAKAYEQAFYAWRDAEYLKTDHNFASAQATAAFEEAIDYYRSRYNNNTLTDQEATQAGTKLGVVATGWRANASSAAAQYLNDGFSLHDFAGALYVNQWSVEGESDGSDFKVPFYEYYGADASTLAQNTFEGSVSGLENGLYEVSVLVRARVTNDADLAQATGITIDVNGGQAVSVTTGQNVANTRFLLGTFKAEGLVKDGTLNFNVNVLEGNNISWLSFQHVKYTKVRNLTPDEEAVVPTAIAIEQGTQISLDQTNNSTQLTLGFTPADATNTVIWSSSDESVATVSQNGLVTGVAPGTAVVTVVSKLNADVQAQIAVSTSYPESEAPATYTVTADDGYTQTIYTLGQNIIKNGSFEYGNPVFGWTTGSGSVNDAEAANFNILTDGAPAGNQYLQSQGNYGGADAHSINTSWPIEPGKKYLFGFKMKASEASAENAYIGVSMSNNKGSENASNKFSIGYGTDWTDVVNIVDNTGTEFTWLVANFRWMASQQSFDNFYLCEITQEEQTINLDNLKDQLQAKVDQALSVAENLVGPSILADQLKDEVESKAYESEEFQTPDEFNNAIKDIDKFVADKETLANMLKPTWTRYQEVKAAALEMVADQTIYESTSQLSTDDADFQANIATTVEDLQQAIAQLRQTVADFIGSVTINEGQSFDITNVFLENPSFDAGNIDGWETNYVSGQQAQNIGYQGRAQGYTNGDVFIQKFIEAWKPQPGTLGDGYLRQTVTGLPEGKYTLDADAISVQQKDENLEVTGSYLYIFADGVDYKTALNTKNNLPEHFQTQFLFTGEGDVQFGLKTEGSTGNWLCADNFVVRYYGIDLSPYKDMLNEAIEEALSLRGDIPDSQFEKLQDVVTEYNKDYTTSQDYSAAIAAIQTATAQAKTYVEPYAVFKEAKDRATDKQVELMEANEDELYNVLTDAIVDATNVAEDPNAGADAYQEAADKIKAALDEVELVLTKRDELTAMLADRKFDLPQIAQDLFDVERNNIYEQIKTAARSEELQALNNVISQLFEQAAEVENYYHIYKADRTDAEGVLAQTDAFDEEANAQAMNLLKQNLDGLFDVIENGDTGGTYAPEAFVEYIGIIAKYYSLIKQDYLPAFIGAVEVIKDQQLDITCLLTNPDVTNLWTGAWNVQPEGWYNEQSGGNFQVMANEDMAPGGEVFMEYWSANAANNGFVLAQKVTLPEGTYKMTGRVGVQQYDGGGETTNVTFSANDIDGTQIPFGPLTDGEIEFVQQQQGLVTIGLKAHEGNNARWMAINKIKLYKTHAKAFEISEAANYDYAQSGAGDVVLTRTIVAGVWNTLVLPFSLTEAELKEAFGQDAEVAEYSETPNELVEGQSTINFNIMATPAIAPNVPVLLRTSTAGSEYTFAGRTLVAAAGQPVKAGERNFDFVGTYEASTTIGAGNYFISSDKLFQATAATKPIKGTRAFIQARQDVQNARITGFSINGEETTAIEGLYVAGQQGQSGKLFNLNGQHIEKAQRGVYIQNGKKVVIR